MSGSEFLTQTQVSPLVFVTDTVLEREPAVHGAPATSKGCTRANAASFRQSSIKFIENTENCAGFKVHFTVSFLSKMSLKQFFFFFKLLNFQTAQECIVMRSSGLK